MSSLFDYSDAEKVVKGTIAVRNTVTAVAPNNGNKEVVFKNFAPFTARISEINNTQIDETGNIDVVMY